MEKASKNLLQLNKVENALDLRDKNREEIEKNLIMVDCKIVSNLKNFLYIFNFWWYYQKIFEWKSIRFSGKKSIATPATSNNSYAIKFTQIYKSKLAVKREENYFKKAQKCGKCIKCSKCGKCTLSELDTWTRDLNLKN